MRRDTRKKGETKGFDVLRQRTNRLTERPEQAHDFGVVGVAAHCLRRPPATIEDRDGQASTGAEVPTKESGGCGEGVVLGALQQQILHHLANALATVQNASGSESPHQQQLDHDHNWVVRLPRLLDLWHDTVLGLLPQRLPNYPTR